MLGLNAKATYTEDEEKEGWAKDGQPAVRRAAFRQDGRYYLVLLAGCGSLMDGDLGLRFLLLLCSFLSPVFNYYQPFFFFNGGLAYGALFRSKGAPLSADDNFLMTDIRRHDPS